MSYTERCVLLVEHPQLTVGAPKNNIGTWATDQAIWPICQRRLAYASCAVLTLVGGYGFPRRGGERGPFASWRVMPAKPIELPEIAKAFVGDMRPFFKAKDQLKQDETASRQLHALTAFSAHSACRD